MKTHAFGFCIAVLYGTVCFASGDSDSPIDGDADYERVKRILQGYSWWNYLPSESNTPYKQMAESLGPESFASLGRCLLDEDSRYGMEYFIVMRVLQSDGQIPTSAGDRGMLNAMSEYVKQNADQNWFTRAEFAVPYILQKGNGGDMETLRYLAQKDYDFNYDVPTAHKIESDAMRLLQARVDGVNLLGAPDKWWLVPASSSDGAVGTFAMLRFSTHYENRLSTNEPPFVPSVTNTGPQAAYVYDLLKQALAKYGEPTNIPPELVKMVVSFDADGKPVCNVNLSKYGLAMPEFALASSRPVPSLPSVTDTNVVAEPPLQQNEQPLPAVATDTNNDTDIAEPAPTPSMRSWFATLLALGTGMVAALVLLITLRNKRRQ